MEAFSRHRVARRSAGARSFDPWLAVRDWSAGVHRRAGKGIRGPPATESDLVV